MAPVHPEQTGPEFTSTSPALRRSSRRCRTGCAAPVIEKGGCVPPIAQAGCVGPDSRISVQRRHLLAGDHVKVPDRCLRCTTDQCLRLSQFVGDGFQSTNKERTVLMLFDYSTACDTVWRTGLLQKMLDIGVPLRFVQWTTAWLTNRIARVQHNGVTGRCRTFKEGLPQGSVLSPLLFVFYINDILGNFSESTMVSAYADHLALACGGRRKEDVALRMQAEVDKVVSWSQQARLSLNAGKCEVAFFSLDNAEVQWRPQITINGVPPSCTAFADVPGRSVRSSYDLRHPGLKGVPANASANQPPSCRGRYDLGLAKARFENSLHCYTTQRRLACSRGMDTLALVLQHREA